MRILVMSLMLSLIPNDQPFFLEFNVSSLGWYVHIQVQDLYAYGGGFN